VALRKPKPFEELEAAEAEQYQLVETSQYKYRVFVTDFVEPIDFVVWFYGQRGGAEDLIKEANNDAGHVRQSRKIRMDLSRVWLRVCPRNVSN
jgi:hypothetical protein